MAAVRAVLCILAVVPIRAAAPGDAAALLAKSAAAFQRNQENEKYWNWIISETRRLTNHGGIALQKLPSVQSESVIIGDGRRCNAVTSWGDGHQAYLKDAAPEDRCQAYNAIGIPFQVALLLKSARAKVAGGNTISIVPDKSRQKDPDYGVSCAASIEATIQLDPATSFPLRIEGRVVDSGCDAKFVPVMYDAPITREPMATNFRKGSTFRVVYGLQKDRFENPAHAFWITIEQHYDQPIPEGMTVLYYWGRQFPIRAAGAQRLVKDIVTTAQEFGAGSQLTFK
jgi:hypothetical protein